MMPKGKREWYVAVAAMGGEHAGNPPCFDASTIYGPYTREQAEAAESIGEGFPDETYAIVTFRADERPPFRSLLKLLRDKVAEENEESEAEERERCARCGTPSEGATARGKV